MEYPETEKPLIEGLFDTSVKEQMQWLVEHKKRTPCKVLEIGGGSGHISCTLSNMGYEVQSVEPMTNAPEYFKLTI